MTTLFFQAALLPEGWAENVRITIAAGTIVRVERDVHPSSRDERRGYAIAGLANVHSHAFQRGMAGLAERRGPEGDNFWTWREVMYRFLDRLTPEDVAAIAAQAYVEMLEAGFTRVGEFHYLHHAPSGEAYDNLAEMAESIAAAAQQTGIGLTLLPVFYAHSNFGGMPPVPGQRRFLNTLERFAALFDASTRAIAPLDGANIGVAPHSLRAVTAEELAAVVSLAEDKPVHIHAAEQTKEVDDCIAWSGLRPVEWLLANAHPDADWCLIHATHITEAETVALAGSGAVAGLCPVTEANLGDGIFPSRLFLSHRGQIAIGTDSNIAIDPAAELRSLEYAQRLFLRSRNVLAPMAGISTGRHLFDAALTGGARALGTDGAGLRQGAPADIVALDPESPALVARRGDSILDSWLFAGGRSCVDSVWRAGHKVVEGGRHRAAEAVLGRYAQALERILY